MSLNLKRSRQYLQEFNFQQLFIEELGWSNPPSNNYIHFEVEGQTFTRVSIAELGGLIVLEITAESGSIPDSRLRGLVYNEVSKLYLENLIIFLDKDRTQSLWYWVKREDSPLNKGGRGGSVKYKRDHLYVKGQPGDLFLSKLGGLVVDISEFEQNSISIVKAVQKLKEAFDIEKVTKRFYTDFQKLHTDFLEFIEGIDNERDRLWYASVVLNRLMFVYFLQRKYFLDNGNILYLENKFQENTSFYQFLNELFFEGFAKRESLRDSTTITRIGQICYLNGGLFLKHRIEQQYEQISISNQAFEQVLKLFSSYSWNLDDTPAGDDNEINPNVLGYIFEKYINQKEFGAYYTRPEITEYLCDRTINKLICARLGEVEQSLNDILLNLNAERCSQLLNNILPTLTILDPACGSGAFLVAAMKTLITIYSTVVGQAQKFSDNPNISKWLDAAKKHPSLDYYIKKRIITDNLYGVDIMEEATEIAKLRLFLALVASARKVEELEPLPNIDFNIMAGNSLIGLIRVDATSFNHLLEGPQQLDLLQPSAAQNYQAILEEKNQSINLYKEHAFKLGQVEGTDQEDRLIMLRDHITRVNQESLTKLNQLLLDEFSIKLGIKYEEVQPAGKQKKRLLKLDDIADLKPFHWGYHFDEVIKRGGFDAIITNPPWEIFKPNAKEFFIKYSDLVSKKKMDIKEFEKKQKELLKDPEVAQAWSAYQSKFPYVSSYYRSAEQYPNQISIVNGKKQGTDINLYKLFTEQCQNLLRIGGDCGLVIPSGIYTDLGAKKLREMLFEQTEITGLFCFENRKTIFEGVHRSFKFVILSFTKGGITEEFPTAFMRLDVNDLLDFPKPEDIHLDIELIKKLSPDSLSIMEFKEERDIVIAKKMLQFPLLGEKIEGKWNLKLTSEFHMTNDSNLFKTETAKGRLPLYEGKMIHQYTHQFALTRYWVDESEARKALLGKNVNDTGQKLDYQGYRLGFRDIASNTNERTLISTITACVFHGNKLPNLKVHDNNGKKLIESSEQILLCAILNSFVIDWMIRQKVTTTLNFFYIYQLPVPRLEAGDKWFKQIVERAAKLICTTREYDDLAKEVGLGSHHNGVTNEVERGKLRAELDGIIAHIYKLTEEEFAYILKTFPIVPDPIKQAALNAYRDVESGIY